MSGDFKGALEIHDKLVGLHSVMFTETSSGPVKHALSLMGKCSAELRLPLVPATEGTQAKVKDALKNAWLI